MKSFGILRTNVGLSTNVKITVESNDRLSLNSINSNPTLSDAKYKKKHIHFDSYYDDSLKKFYKETPIDISYHIKYDNDIDLMGTDFKDQYDELYSYGAKNIIENEYYNEEYEYFAPLYINPNHLPSNFIIFRVDGSGIETLTKDNFKKNVLKKFKTVKVFDLDKESNIGKWLRFNFVDNDTFPIAPLEINFNELEFSKWNGIDYDNGGYTSKSFFINDILEKESDIFDLEKYIFDMYKRNKVIFPNIINFSFLFDDPVATPDEKRKWSLNRYYGFYVNSIDFETTMSPYKPIGLKNGFNESIKIKPNNTIVVYEGSDEKVGINPFTEDWDNTKPNYIEYNNEFYLIERYIENWKDAIQNIDEEDYVNEEYDTVRKYIYKIITDIDIYSEINAYEIANNPNLNVDGNDHDVNIHFNKNYGIIKDNFLKNGNGDDDYFQIKNIDEASVWLIEIDGIYHNLIKDDVNATLGEFYENGNSISIKIDIKDEIKISYNTDYILTIKRLDDNTVVSNISTVKNKSVILTFSKSGNGVVKLDDVSDINLKIDHIKNRIKINSDYGFEFPEDNNNYFKYKVAGIETTIDNKVDFNTKDPNRFKIYKLNFSDIKDFDTRIVDTEYSKFEYELEDDLTNTDEPKFYLENPNSKSDPKDLDDFVFKNNVVNIPVSSEYTTNYETFKIKDNNLSKIWRINPIYCRWGFQKSLAFQDYPYLLNNNTLFELNNKCPDPFKLILNRSDRNLDYFYSINSQSLEYLSHSLHIEDYTINRKDYKFDTFEYLNGEYDYFTYFFKRAMRFNFLNIKKNVRKYSYFNKGDKSLPNNTLFKGGEFRLYDIESIKLNALGDIETLNVSNSNTFEDYKFSILLNNNGCSCDNCIDFGEYLTPDDEYNTWEFNNSPEFSFSSTPDGNNYIRLFKSESENPEDYITTEPIIISNRPMKVGIKYYLEFKIDLLQVKHFEILINGKLLDLEKLKISGPENRQIYTIPLDNIHIKKDKLPEINFTTDGSFTLRDIRLNENDDCVTKIEKSNSLEGENIEYDGYVFRSGDFLGDIFWTPDTNEEVVIYNGNYYYKNPNTSSTPYNIWNPTVSYVKNAVVMYRDNYYKSLEPSNTSNPLNSSLWELITVAEGDKKWLPIEYWNPNKEYEPIINPHYTFYQGAIFKSEGSEIGEEPGISTTWELYLNIDFDNDFNLNDNYVLYNGNYYITNGMNDLKSGINIYINKKWKNVFIEIYDDFIKTSNVNRDDVYEDNDYENLTFNRFIKCINTIDNKYSFINYLKYIIIEEDGSYTEYDYLNDIENLPYLLTVNLSDGLIISLKESNNYSSNKISVANNIKKREINDLDKLNFYNNIPLSVIEKENVKITNKSSVFKNYNSMSNDKYFQLQRFSGYYMPIFYDIQLFNTYSYRRKVGNYIFDTDLEEFGIMKERKIKKINRKESVLKLKNSEEDKSIYPMIQEFGYDFKDFMIFKSTWDKNYFEEILPNTLKLESSKLTIKPKFNISELNIGIKFDANNKFNI